MAEELSALKLSGERADRRAAINEDLTESTEVEACQRA